MSQDEKGKRFLELIDEQNKIQWNIIKNLSLLINSNWNSQTIQKELESLLSQHSKISKELNEDI